MCATTTVSETTIVAPSEYMYYLLTHWLDYLTLSENQTVCYMALCNELENVAASSYTKLTNIILMDAPY